ncbi:MAG: potassium channel family protein [Candidatus Micrarchaeota archaeon]
MGWLSSRLGYGIFLLLSVWVIGGLMLNWLEGWRMLDAFYAAAMTMTTVGYGDFVPQHDPTKIFLIFYSFTGIGITLYVLSLAAGHYFEARYENVVLERAKKQHIRTDKLKKLFEPEF